ncbi:HypC/HybG/HupF family hydrogenase formation chaperone [Methylocystis heyeri]|uniref:HypC/HybG/HupF family hydrogenase formation chaperone n=1 Tax=Methylocystis heyeri TaxID=391905 RepID=A0A6B8K835_9HYPH|nr:HypC/HybG/HupF family hydrogenase formation chaperone [Methylocystis heyeri]QGM44374.1 HypC/HybG/HupF family hydrogenase formation chaperone [Methylocystis heyeri]
MCIGVPMKVLESDEFSALCESEGERLRVSTLLVGPQPPGAHVLVHLGSAVRVLDDHEAALISSALAGLGAAMGGQGFERHFADLIDREPQLPDHLKRN